jgi:zinc transport system substrate-binding protein
MMKIKNFFSTHNTLKKFMTYRLLFLATFLFALSSCAKKETPTQQKPTVLVSVPPYAYFVNKIAQGLVDVEVLVPNGTNPHIYEPTPRQVQRHQNAALWVYLGESFDKKILQFFRDTHQPIRIVDVAQGISLLSSHQDQPHHCCHHSHGEGEDLHLWLSPALAKQQAQNIADGLIALLPEQKEELNGNLQLFLSELDALDAQVTEILAPMRGKAILVSHPAFAYLCRDHDIVQLSIEMEGKDPLPQHVTATLAKANSYAIRNILIEPQYSNKGATLIAQSLGVPTYLVDPYAENYADNLLDIAKAIAK